MPRRCHGLGIRKDPRCLHRGLTAYSLRLPSYGLFYRRQGVHRGRGQRLGPSSQRTDFLYKCFLALGARRNWMARNPHDVSALAAVFRTDGWGTAHHIVCFMKFDGLVDRKAEPRRQLGLHQYQLRKYPKQTKRFKIHIPIDVHFCSKPAKNRQSGLQSIPCGLKSLTNRPKHLAND